MPTLVLATGFEHGSNAGLRVGNNGVRFSDTPAGAPTIATVTSGVGVPRSGTYCLEASATAGTSGIAWDANTFGSITRIIAGFAIRFVGSLPAGDVLIAAVQSNSTHDGGLFYRSSGTKLVVQLDGTNDVGSFTVVADTWYWIDLQVDFTGATSTMDWQVDGAAQTQATVTQTTTVFSLLLGWEAAATATVRYDDLVVSTTAADYPLGPHKVVLLSVDPAGTVTLSGTTGNFNTFTSNGTLAAWNATTARNNIDEVPPTIGATADGWVQITLQSTNYVEMPMTTYTLAAGETISGARMLAVGWATSTTAATIGFRSWNGTTETTLFAAADPNFDNSTTAPAWVCKMLTLADIDTQAELDALAFRAGFSTDATPDIGIHAIYAELAVKLAASGTAITLNDSGSVSDSLGADVAATLNDQGTVTDSPAIAVALALTDVGAGTDTVTVAVPKSLNDVGTATDSLAAAAAVPLAETGSGTDTVTVAAAVPLSDTGTATDSIAVGIPKPLADAGAAADTVTTTATVPLAEVGAAADAMAVVAAIPLADTGVASDSIIVAQIVAKPLADQGTCSDSLIVTIAATLVEVGAAADTLAATVLLTLTDQTVGADTLTVSAVAPFTVGTLTATDGPAATLTTARSATTLTVADAGGQLAATDVSIATLTALAAAGGPS